MRRSRELERLGRLGCAARRRGGVVAALVLWLAAPRPSVGAVTRIVPDQYGSIQAALNAAQAGDTVSVKDTPGPYFEKISFPASGDATNGYITLQAYPGDHPILDGTDIPGDHMVLIDSRSYVKLVGFEIRNNLGANDGSGVRVQGSGSSIEIRDNSIHDIRGRHAMGITVYGTAPAAIAALTIDGNEIYDCEPFRSEALVLNGNVSDFAVTNNVVRDVNNIGIDCIGGETDIQPDPALVCRNGTISGNQVYRANQKGGGFAAGIYVDGGKSVTVENNVVAECDLGIEIGAENAGVTAENITVRNNVVYRNVKAGIAFGGYAAGVGRVENSRFLNNTAYMNDSFGAGYGELWVQYASANVVQNNVFYGTGKTPLLANYAGDDNNSLDYNVWFSDPAGTVEFVWHDVAYGSFAAYQIGAAQDANSRFVDMRLLDPAAGDFHLAAGSPARDAGDPGFTPDPGEVDIDGAARVSGGRVDAGADEFTCGDATVDTGEQCDDGNLIDGDGCDSNCTATACGNGVTTAGEQCDDGNTTGGDCCSAGCQFETAGGTCDDGDRCTINDACDGAGACIGAAQPAPSCRTPGSASLVLRDRANDRADTLVWRWVRGQESLLPAFGNPLQATAYTLCLYDASTAAQPLLRAEVPAGQTCAGRPCWRATGTRGYRYADKYRSPDGVSKMRLRAGVAGKPRVTVSGKGLSLPLPALGLTTPVTVQLANSAGECWEASFATVSRNDAELFRARTN